jgi:hypothetical protein
MWDTVLTEWKAGEILSLDTGASHSFGYGSGMGRTDI